MHDAKSSLKQTIELTLLTTKPLSIEIVTFPSSLKLFVQTTPFYLVLSQEQVRECNNYPPKYQGQNFKFLLQKKINNVLEVK